ncbi:MAG: DUF853 domain-containing protein [Clostridia bacterium]|nr:DUF853 domain-containing protein [Clostridia bacterium]
MFTNGKIWIAKSDDKKLFLEPSMANRHGLIAGATGTGKTITMKVLAESFSDMGVPVFFADVKAALSGMGVRGDATEDRQTRITNFGIEHISYKPYPTCFWDIFGEVGHPVRVTVSGMGPMLLSRLFGLTEVQAGVLNIVFRVADDNGLLLLDLKDLRAMLQYVGDNRAEFTTEYGNVSTASIGAIQRALLSFEDEGGANIFGEPALEIKDWMRTDSDGRGYINILSSAKLIQSPTVYATFLLWMLTELFERLPEVGDLEKPRMIFFFDEAHLLFTDANKALVQKIVQVVKLIRSKGVGVYFVTQSPSDIPGDVLAQLSNRIQHALRAYTPAEQKAVRAAARAFRANPAFDTEEALTSLGVGEALVSMLDEKGIPALVEKAKILPPQSLMGPADEGYVERLIAKGEFEDKYRESVDRESAYERIMAANEELAAAAAAEAEEKQAAKAKAKSKSKLGKEAKNTAKKAATSISNTVTNAVGTNIVNSIAGGKKTDGKTIAKRAATNALKSVLRSGTNAIIRGLFGNKK